MTPMKVMKTCSVATRPDLIDRQKGMGRPKLKFLSSFLLMDRHSVDGLERHVGQGSLLKTGLKGRDFNGFHDFPQLFHRR